MQGYNYGTEGWVIARTEKSERLFLIPTDLVGKKVESHVQYPSCMIRKNTLEDPPKLKERALKPLAQVNMDSFSTSVTSIEGCLDARICSQSRVSFGLEPVSDGSGRYTLHLRRGGPSSTTTPASSIVTSGTERRPH